MARARNIKPGFFTNDQLAEVDPIGRLLFAGLWTLADREGRLHDRPKKIKAEVLPYDDADVDALLTILADRGFILRYSVAGVAYLQVVNWAKHQSPHHKETDSDIPAPDQHGADTASIPTPSGTDEALAPVEHQTNTGQAPVEHEINRADSGYLIPDTLNLIPDTLTPPKPPKGADRAPTPLHGPNLGVEQRELFERFWRAYPKRQAKAEAVRWWQRAKPDPDTVAAMLDGIARQLQSASWQSEGGRFIPMPSTWLNQRRWEDETAMPPPRLPHNHPEMARRRIYD